MPGSDATYHSPHLTSRQRNPLSSYNFSTYMIIKRATLENGHKDTDTAIAIDVIRAFTTSAFAFSQGAHEIALVSAVEYALKLKARFPHALIMGEDGGHPVEGFDFGNSPTLLLDQDLSHFLQQILRPH